jgi:hypothetical protein
MNGWIDKIERKNERKEERKKERVKEETKEQKTCRLINRYSIYIYSHIVI